MWTICEFAPLARYCMLCHAGTVKVHAMLALSCTCCLWHEVGQQLSHFLCSCSTSSTVQAVPHPEAGSIGKEPGELPPRAKTASAYFEVTVPCWCSGCLLGAIQGSWQSDVHSMQAVTGVLLMQAAHADASES